MNHFKRGYAIEPFFTGSHAMKAPNYPVIDAFDYMTGHATSVKSMNVFAKTYSGNTTKMNYTLRKYTDHLDGFRGRDWGSDNVTSRMIKSKELVIAVDPKAFSDPAFQKTVSYMQDYVNTLNKNNNVSINLSFQGIM